MEKFRLSENIDPNKVFIVNRSELEGRIDPNFYKTVNKNIVNKIKKNNFYTIKDIVRFSSETWDQKSIFDSEFPYIEISNIDLSDGTIKDVKLIGVKEAPSRAKMIVRKNDIIISTTRPTRGAISIQKNSSIQIASTGFSVIREINEKLFLREALFHILRLSFVSIQMGQRSSGGNYPAITQEELGRIVIPAISLSIQEKINNIYNKAYTEKQQKEAEAQKLLDSIDDYLLGELGITLPKEEECLQQTTNKHNSYNLDNDNPLVKKGRLFLTNLSEVTGKRWSAFEFKNRNLKLEDGDYPNKTLKHLAHLLKGQSITSNEIEKGNYPVIAGGQISPYTHNQYNFKGNVITISASGAYSGYVWYHNYPIFASDCTVIFSKEESEITTLYLSEILKLKQKEIYNLQQGAGQPHVYARDLERINIPIPPLQKQNEIATHISQIRNKANALKQEGKEILEQAKQEVEQMILGN